MIKGSGEYKKLHFVESIDEKEGSYKFREAEIRD